MGRLVSGVCEAHGATGEFTYSQKFASTINSANEARVAAKVAAELFGEVNADDSCMPQLTSEDFGFMLQHKRGCYLLLGNGGDGPGGCGLHSPHYDFNDEILTVGADFWVQHVDDQLHA